MDVPTHPMPPAAWLNDPNGLTQADGVFHTYFQYAPFDVDSGVKAWGHATSRDLMTWDYVGAPLLPDDEPTYGNDPTVAEGWQHCMTVPRELTR